MPNNYAKPADMTVTNTHLTDLKGVGFVKADHNIKENMYWTKLTHTNSSDIKITADKLDPRIPASGTLCIESDILASGFIASDDILHSNDAEVDAGNSETYVKVKEIVCAFTGTYRVKFDLKSVLPATGYGTIYLGGAAHGTEMSEAGETYVEQSEDLAFTQGDLLQLYLKVSSSSYNALAQNLRICGKTKHSFINNI